MDSARRCGTTRTARRVLVALAALAAGMAAHVPTASAATAWPGRATGARCRRPGRLLRCRPQRADPPWRTRSRRTCAAGPGRRPWRCATTSAVSRSRSTAPSATTAPASSSSTILQTLLRQRHGALTSSQRALAAKMIQKSDNAAASALWRQIGGGKGLAAYTPGRRLQHTTPGPGGYWGLAVTSASDQRRLVALVSSATTPCWRTPRADLRPHDARRRSQRWGVSAGVPSGARWR